MRPDLYNAGFELLTTEHVPGEAGAHCILELVRALVAIDRIYLRHYPQTPPLLLSGVRYRRQRLGQDRWIDIPRMLETREGSCEDLTAWRCAELLERLGEPAVPFVSWEDMQWPNGEPFTLTHILVHRPNYGVIEDLSRLLGMDQVPFDL